MKYVLILILAIFGLTSCGPTEVSYTYFVKTPVEITHERDSFQPTMVVFSDGTQVKLRHQERHLTKAVLGQETCFRLQNDRVVPVPETLCKNN